MDKTQFEIICNKIDKLTAVIVAQQLEDKDKKIYALKRLNLTSKEIGDMLGLGESTIRESEGWKRK